MAVDSCVEYRSHRGRGRSWTRIAIQHMRGFFSTMVLALVITFAVLGQPGYAQAERSDTPVSAGSTAEAAPEGRQSASDMGGGMQGMGMAASCCMMGGSGMAAMAAVAAVFGVLAFAALALFVVFEIQWIRYWSVRLKRERAATKGGEQGGEVV